MMVEDKEEEPSLPEMTGSESVSAANNGDEKENLELAARATSIREEQAFLTSQISETCRYIGYGVMALFFAIHTSESDFAEIAVQRYGKFLSVAAALAVLTILFDYGQYMSGYRASEKAIANIRKKYNKKWISRRLRYFFFYAKQYTAAAAALIVVVSVGVMLLSSFGCIDSSPEQIQSDSDGIVKIDKKESLGGTTQKDTQAEK